MGAYIKKSERSHTYAVCVPVHSRCRFLGELEPWLSELCRKGWVRLSVPKEERTKRGF